MTLTPAGRNLLAPFARAFDALADATHALRNLRPNGDIHIATLPSIAQLWLPKRLGHIREAFPHLNFSVTALEKPPSLSRELFDLSLFIGEPGGSPDEIILAQDEILPVCSPGLLKSLSSDVSLEEALRAMPLLHDQSWGDDWQLWAKAEGVALDDPHQGPRFSLYSLAVEEAKAGAGALIGHVCLIEEALATGSLVPMKKGATKTGHALLLSFPPSIRQRPEIIALADLLK